MTLHPFSIWQGGNEVILSFWTASVWRQGHEPGQVKLSHQSAQRADVTVGGSWSTRRETATTEHTHWTQKEQLPPSEAIVLTMLILLAFRGVQVYRKKKKKRYHHPKESKMNSSCWLWLDDGPPDHVEKHAKPSFIAQMDHRCSRNLWKSPHTKNFPFDCCWPKVCVSANDCYYFHLHQSRWKLSRNHLLFQNGRIKYCIVIVQAAHFGHVLVLCFFF